MRHGRATYGLLSRGVRARMAGEGEGTGLPRSVTEAMSNHRAVTTAMHEHKLATSEQCHDEHMAAAQNEQSEAEEQAAYAAITLAMDNHRAVANAVHKHRDQVMAKAVVSRGTLANGEAVKQLEAQLKQANASAAKALADTVAHKDAELKEAREAHEAQLAKKGAGVLQGEEDDLIV